MPTTAWRRSPASKPPPAIDIVVTDINMPRMDGLTLLDRLSGWERPVKVIIVSAYGGMSNIHTAMNRGTFDFITKPIDFADLEAPIRAIAQARMWAS